MTTSQSSEKLSRQIEELNQEDKQKYSNITTSTHSSKVSISIGLYVSDSFHKNYWAVDSGATDHKPHQASPFIIYTPCPSGNRRHATKCFTYPNICPSCSKSFPQTLCRYKSSLIICIVIFSFIIPILYQEDSRKMIGPAREQDGPIISNYITITMENLVSL